MIDNINLDIIPEIVKKHPGEEEIIIGIFNISSNDFCFSSVVFNIFKFNLEMLKEKLHDYIIDDKRYKVIIVDLSNEIFRKYPVEEILADLIAHEYIHYLTDIDTDSMHDYPAPLPDIYQYNLPWRAVK